MSGGSRDGEGGRSNQALASVVLRVKSKEKQEKKGGTDGSLLLRFPAGIFG